MRKQDNNNHTSEKEKKHNAIDRLVEVLLSVDIKSKESKINETTISDGNGGRILL